MSSAMDARRSFLEVALSTGIECKIITPEDVLRHVEPDVLAAHLPEESKTRLLSASLKAGKMDPGLVFETIEPSVFAEHMPEHMLWACIAEAAARVLEGSAPSSRLGAGMHKSSSLLGDATSSRTAPRRPNASRRPARLAQPLTARPAPTSTPIAASRTKASVDYDLDADASATSSPGAGGTGAMSVAGAGGASRPVKEPLDDEHFSDWIEETVTGPEALNRRKR